MEKKFPKDFLWGTATSSYQIEGGNFLSDWNSWAKQGKAPEAGLASDHTRHLDEDIDLMKSCGSNAYRMSVEWSRIYPEIDQVDTKAIEYYQNEIKKLQENNITVFLTLYHFTLPQWFADLGGWERKSNLKYFLDFTDTVSKALPTVKFWTTINEPTVYSMQAYFKGVFPPGKKSFFKTFKIVNRLISAHKKAYKIIHQNVSGAQVGIAQNALCLSPWPKKGFLFKIANYFINRYWNHYFFLRSPKTHDYIGLNYYFHYYLKVGLFGIKVIAPEKLNLQLTQRGWEVYPDGIKELCLNFKKYNLPIYILENGIATNEDKQREKFILGHVSKVLEAINAGADVRGYFYWSLLDNYEWEQGFGPRFGLVDIDYSTHQRKLRPSGLLYANIAKNNGINYDEIKELTKE